MTAPDIVRDTPISAGEAAPDFTLKTQAIEDWSLADAVRRSDVVLCFYPMDFSPVCSTEMNTGWSNRVSPYSLTGTSADVSTVTTPGAAAAAETSRCVSLA